VLARHNTIPTRPMKPEVHEKCGEYCQLGEKESDNQTSVKPKSEPSSSLRMCKCHTLPQTVVAIKSMRFDRKYVRMLSHQGSVGIGTVLEASDTFELVRHVGGMVSFKSTTQTECYLSVNGEGVVGGKWTEGGGGVVQCAHSCGPAEKFGLHWPRKIPGHEGDVEVGIESIAYRGRFLSLDANLGKVNLQGVKGYPERFILVLAD